MTNIKNHYVHIEYLILISVRRNGEENWKKKSTSLFYGKKIQFPTEYIGILTQKYSILRIFHEKKKIYLRVQILY